jgi:hypothetical protein
MTLNCGPATPAAAERIELRASAQVEGCRPLGPWARGGEGGVAPRREEGVREACVRAAGW